MLRTILGLLLGTAAEVAGLTYWRRFAAADDAAAGALALAAGGAVGWALSAALVVTSPASHPRRAGTVPAALALLAGMAAMKVGLWLGWAALAGLATLTAATAVLAAALHLKHAVSISAVSGYRLRPTFWDPRTVAATAAAAGGPAVWVALLAAGHPGWAAAALGVFLAAENALQFLAGGLFDPPDNAQSAFTIVTEVRPGAADRLRDYLSTIGATPRAAAAAFGRYDRLHFCSFVLLDADPSDPAPVLVFEGNVDGPPLAFLREMAAADPDFLRTVYSACVDFPAAADPAAVADYLAEHDAGATALYVGMPGLTLEQIRRDAALRAAVEDELDARLPDYLARTPAGCRDHLQALARGRADLAWAEDPVRQLFRVRYGPAALAGVAGAAVGTAVAVAAALAAVDGWGVVGIAAGTVAAAAGLAVPAYLVWLRWRERTDVQLDQAPTSGRLEALQGREDLQLQNHLVSVSEVKPQRLRLATLRAVLWVINAAARYLATRGNLGGIVTIHFARWVVMPRPGRPSRLLFLSNYDGSWENYLGEFIDRASDGLTAVWSNTGLGPGRGFPTTRWLFVAGGSRDEQRFKNIVRLSQRTSAVWYTAYPALSVKQIKNNQAFRAGLFGPCPDVAGWLRRV